MTLEDLGNLSEVIGAIAVVISLVYLAVQIRQNTAQIRESSQVSRLLLQENFVSGQEQLIRGFLENDDMFRVWRLGTTTTDELSGDDQERFGLILYGQMYRYHVMYQAINVEPLEEKRCLIQIDRLAAMPAFRSWWSRQRSGFAFDPGFVKLVDDRIISVKNQDAP
jgi:hypothetical protein